MVDFVTMTKADARTYFTSFMAEMGSSLQRLSQQIAASRAAHAIALDDSPESLEPLWAWAVPRFAWREGYEPPPARSGIPGPRIAVSQLEPNEQLPSWFHHPSAAGYATFSAASLHLIDQLGRYLGNVVIHHVAGSRWQIGNSPVKGYIFQNQPVIAGLGDEESPFHVCANLAARALQPDQVRGVRTLREVYDLWVTTAKQNDRGKGMVR